MGKDVVGLRAAAKVAGVSDVAVLDWCRKLGIGELREGKWHIDRRKLRAVMRARQLLRLREPA